jgi:hypothetical protein
MDNEEATRKERIRTLDHLLGIHTKTITKKRQTKMTQPPTQGASQDKEIRNQLMEKGIPRKEATRTQTEWEKDLKLDKQETANGHMQC